MRTGLAKNAQDALNIVTVGFQAGDDKAGDFLDTLNEYGTQFRKLGLDGKEATGLISQGLKAGARDGDLVADALKEFSIRAVDGSKTTKKGFEALGLSASEDERADRQGRRARAQGPRPGPRPAPQDQGPRQAVPGRRRPVRHSGRRPRQGALRARPVPRGEAASTRSAAPPARSTPSSAAPPSSSSSRSSARWKASLRPR
jgi:hypothetical protein